jgi:hypothetical protein
LTARRAADIRDDAAPAATTASREHEPTRRSVVLYELREYTAVPGKLPALVKRFNDHTLELFEKRGIDVVFISHTEFGENSTGEIVYLVRWDSYQQLQETWSRFLSDPEWVRVKQDSERDGPLVAAVRRRMLNTNPFNGPTGNS